MPIFVTFRHFLVNFFTLSVVPIFISVFVFVFFLLLQVRVISVGQEVNALLADPTNAEWYRKQCLLFCSLSAWDAQYQVFDLTSVNNILIVILFFLRCLC